MVVVVNTKVGQSAGKHKVEKKISQFGHAQVPSLTRADVRGTVVAARGRFGSRSEAAVIVQIYYGYTLLPGSALFAQTNYASGA